MSRQYFDFSTLIQDYSNVFTVITHEGGGYNEAGDWNEGNEMRTEYMGAIIAFKESKVFRSEGKITTQDRRLFVKQSLPQALMGATVIFRGNKYMIESEHENAEFTGVYSYFLRYVSAFGGEESPNA
jgi:hypothetical protein